MKLIFLIVFSLAFFNNSFSQTNEIDSINKEIFNFKEIKEAKKLLSFIENLDANYHITWQKNALMKIYIKIKSNDNNFKYSILNQLAIVHMSSGQIDSSVFILNKVITEAPKTELTIQKVAHESIALNYCLNQNFDLAIKHFKTLIYNYSSSIDSSEHSKILYSLGQIYSNLGLMDSAINYANKVILLNFKDTNTIISCQMIIGNIYLKNNELDKSIEYFYSAYNNSVSSKNKNYTSISSKCLARVHLAQNNSLKANKYIEISEKNFEYKNDFFHKASIKELKGDIKYNLTQYKKALSFYLKAKSLYKKAKSNIDILVINNKIAKLYLKLKKDQYEPSFFLDYENQTSKINNKQYPDIVEVSYKTLSEYYLNRNNANKVFKYKNLQIGIKDSASQINNNKFVKDALTKYETEKKEAQIVLQDKELALQKASIAKERQQKWIVGGGALLLMLLAGLFYSKYRSKQKFKLEKQQLTAEKDILELEQKLLLTQMNPHFIFNSLNSIKAFIISNKSTEANSYLSDFSKLMRLILDSSRKELIPLEDEVNMLSYYLKLEQLRLGNKMEYDIYINPELQDELEELSIPPMLIQPYIENAIKHGITNKTEIGKIKLRFDYGENDTIKIDIIDDGVGREKALEIKSRVIQTHESAAMQITQERIEGFNRDNTNTPIEIKIIDLFSENQVATGTRVSVVLPALSA